MSTRCPRSPALTHLFCATIAVVALSIPATGLAQETTERFDSLIAQWRIVPAGSEEEQAIEDAIQALVPRLLGEQAVETFGRYLLADIGSEEEAQALEETRALASERVRWPRARELLEVYWTFRSESDPSFSSVMDDAPTYVGSSDIDIFLESSQPHPTAGERFAVLGTITNRRREPVWLVNSFTTLMPPPEIWGSGSRVGSVGAFFPSVPSVPTGEVVRIDPGKSYDVIWNLDPSSDSANIGRPWREFLQFRPGQYRFTALVHTWPKPPILAAGNVENLSDSEIARADVRIEMGLPVLILLIGAVIGGLVAFIVRSVGVFKAGCSATIRMRSQRQSG